MTTLLFMLISSVALGGVWERTLDGAVPSVVMIKTYSPRAFDGKGAGAGNATGFVVDAEQGIILTNRHVVRPGPVVAEAVFQNNEEVALVPIYRDPVHDFGFFRFDPADVRFQKLKALSLRPEHARRGTEVRLIGSDAGEKVSILSGILANLDRAAPVYGRGRYNDFNTFYIQAAAGSSGGSSGSPVVDVHGHVVALNAGASRKAASSFFLPLDRVKRALKLVQQSQPVSRGTVHTSFLYKTYDQAGRLGLSSEAEASARKSDPSATGVLVVERVLNEGSGDGRLEPGDILIGIDGTALHDFVTLDSMLDSSVGKRLMFEIERGGDSLRIDVPIADLHRSSPAEYAELGGGVFHQYSYQMARHFAGAAQGIYLADPGYVFRPLNEGRIISNINGVEVQDLDDFVSAVSAIPDRADFVVRHHHPSRPQQSRVDNLKMNRTWFPAQRCRWDASSWWWPCEAMPEPDTGPKAKQTGAIPRVVADRRARKYSGATVRVSQDLPFKTDGARGRRFVGGGLVVDKERGLVLVDQDTVVVGLGDVTISFSYSSGAELSAEVVALHPTLNIALIQYDPSLIPDAEITEIRFDGKPIVAGDKVHLIGTSQSNRMESEKRTVRDVRTASQGSFPVPTFRHIGTDVIHVSMGSSYFVGGFLTDKRGRPSALWAHFPVPGESSGWWAGIPGAQIEEFLQDYTGAWSLGVEWGMLPLAEARRRGVDMVAAKKLAASDTFSQQVLEAKRITRGGAADGKLLPGDILLAVGGKTITGLSGLTEMLDGEERMVDVWRGGRKLQQPITSARESTKPLERVLMWGGGIFQEPNLPVAQQMGQERVGVYVSQTRPGSPVGRHLPKFVRVVAVNGQPTPDLDRFVDAVRKKKAGESVRMAAIDLRGNRRMYSMKADDRYWPLVEFNKNESGWSRTSVQNDVGTDSGAGGE
jgi:S1-C subfamily serine protease